MKPQFRIEVDFDCADPLSLAGFWQQVLGYGDPVGDGKPFVDLPAPSDGAAWLAFQKVPEPKSVKNRIHLDLYCSNPLAEVARVEALGARRLGDPVLRRNGSFSFQVMADPEGNEFCICKEHH